MKSKNAMITATLTDLPKHLLERARIHQEGTNNQASYILYWMRTAVRADENPALDTAIHFAQATDLPLLLYHAISQHYEFASDRHHTFMLQGARDVQSQLQGLNISYAFHLATPDDSKPYLRDLGNRAAVVVTEDMPVDPPRRFLKSLAEQVTTAIVCVDTACVVPMQLINKPYTRAFQFRSATQKLYDQRLTRQWPSTGFVPKKFDLNLLPFVPFDLQTEELSKLVAQCEIDHAVGPVVDTVGGSEAGYDRWNGFKQKGLAGYAKKRNNALLDGVSRMSAYLHYGMVSPMRIAREAANLKHAGAEKYLDELLIWRELAYSFCFHRQDHDQWTAIPDWARATLETHADDNRESVYSWEELARAQTDDQFWNAAQISLLRQGELHNNVRMTWGKAILNWVQSPQKALQVMIDLNHRYALDGRDPASYGGLLWCLGQFDRPFQPQRNIFGSVRHRTTKDHANRLDINAYLQKVAAPRYKPIPNVAVIGAGMSGLFAARTLADHGIRVTVFDKGRGIGGRMSTRRVDGQPCFDHGAQYFTARDPRFQRYVQSWLDQGIVARWPDADQKIVVFDQGMRSEKSDSVDRYVGTPAMNVACKHLAKSLDVQVATRIGKVENAGNQIRLIDTESNEMGDFDRLVVSAPAEQAAELLASFPNIAEPISKVRMQPCWAVMASFEDPVAEDWVGAFIHNSIVTWAARNNTKPQRPTDQEHLLLHAGPEWTQENWENEPNQVAEEVVEAFWKSSGIIPQNPTHLQAHRWKYAIPVDPPTQRCYVDETSRIVACGDWAGGPRVEGAFLSGMSAAGIILGTLESVSPERTQQLNLFS